MAKVLGVGGVFFRSKDPQALADWYKKHLGMDVEAWGSTHGMGFGPEQMPKKSYTVWSVFPADSDYLGKQQQGFMINLVVDNLAEMLEQLKAGGVEVEDSKESSEYGDFGWFYDLDDNKVELWQP